MFANENILLKSVKLMATKKELDESFIDYSGLLD